MNFGPSLAFSRSGPLGRPAGSPHRQQTEPAASPAGGPGGVQGPLRFRVGRGRRD